MEDIIIRKVKFEDIKEVAEIQVNGWKTSYKGIIDDIYLKSITIEDKIKERERDYNKNEFIVAEINGEVVGFCRYICENYYNSQIKDADCELLSIYVKSNLKQHGIGTKLFEYVKNDLENKNKNKMILWCLKDNISSKIFYKKMGGKLIKEKYIEIGYKKYLVECYE